MSTNSEYIAAVNEGAEIGVTAQPFFLFRIWQNLVSSYTEFLQLLKVQKSAIGSTDTYTHILNLDLELIEVTDKFAYIKGLNAYNPNAYPVYLKFYNDLAENVTVGLTNVEYQVMIPATGQIILDAPTIYAIMNSALTMCITKFYPYNDATNVSSTCLVKLKYSLSDLN